MGARHSCGQYLAIKQTQIAFAFFSDRRSPKGIACLAIGCRKIASKRLAIQHSQIASDYVASFDCQITIAYSAIKERKIAESI